MPYPTQHNSTSPLWKIKECNILRDAIFESEYILYHTSVCIVPRLMQQHLAFQALYLPWDELDPFPQELSFDDHSVDDLSFQLPAKPKCSSADILITFDHMAIPDHEQFMK